MNKLYFTCTVLLLTMFALGCTYSGNNQAESSQDAEWYQSFITDSHMLASDFQTYSLALQISDYSTIISTGQHVVNDTQAALDDNSKYTTSPKYHDAQNEYVLMLQDSLKAGNAMIKLGTDGKAGLNTTDDIWKVTYLTSSAVSHINRYNAYLNNTKTS